MHVQSVPWPLVPPRAPWSNEMLSGAAAIGACARAHADSSGSTCARWSFMGAIAHCTRWRPSWSVSEN
eukprot:scaffold1471_cov73-Phaeocystis_antarctica.AAC.3